MAETWWDIAHPGTGERIRCESFKQAMDEWFEGFNVPYLVTDGIREPLASASQRVREFYVDERKGNPT